MGFVRDYDRYVSFEQIGVEPDSVYNAEPGVHYVSFDDEEVRHLMVLPPGRQPQVFRLSCCVTQVSAIR